MATKEQRQARLQEIRENYDISDDDWEALEGAFAGESMRGAIKDLQKQLGEFKDDAEKWRRTEKEQGVKKRFEDAGVDWEKLSRLERRSLVAEADALGDDEALKDFIDSEELPLREATPEAEETPEAGKVMQFGREGRGRREGGGAGALTPEAFKDWPMEKRAKFRTEHPEEHSELLKGNPVNVAT